MEPAAGWITTLTRKGTVNTCRYGANEEGRERMDLGFVYRGLAARLVSSERGEEHYWLQAYTSSISSSSSSPADVHKSLITL
jgi:hypothetical protein